jgi:hypothetical protein
MKLIPTIPDASGMAPNHARRMMLGALLSASTAALIPWALAAPVADEASGAFLALSAIIAGRQSLDAVQARRLYAALCADDAGFAAAAQALLALINTRKLDAATLQHTLDDDKSALAGVPRKVATAWFAGVVGSGAKARCLAYETALNAQVVADVLKPPSYAYGAYGSWTSQPHPGPDHA